MDKREAERLLAESRALEKVRASLRDCNDAHIELLEQGWSVLGADEEQALIELGAAGDALGRVQNTLALRIAARIGGKT